MGRFKREHSFQFLQLPVYFQRVRIVSRWNSFTPR